PGKKKSVPIAGSRQRSRLPRAIFCFRSYHDCKDPQPLGTQPNRACCSESGNPGFFEFSWIRALACTRPLGRNDTAFGVTSCGTKPSTPCFSLPSGQREQRSSEIFSAASDAYYAFAIAKT